MSVDFTQIGTTPDWWFWGIAVFGGKLYVGTYDLSGHSPTIYNYPSWQGQKTFDPRESVIRLSVFKSELYGAIEGTSWADQEIYKMNTADPTDWDRVLALPYGIVPQCFTAFGDYLYCTCIDINHVVTIWRSFNGGDWEELGQSWNDKGLISSIVYNNQLYILGRVESTGKSWSARSSNGTSWSDVGVLCGRDYSWSRATVFEGNLFIGQWYAVSVYKYNGSALTKVLQTNVGANGCHSCCVCDGQLYFLFGQAWKASSGNSFLYRSPTGDLNDWGSGDLYGSPLHTFTDKQNARCIIEYDGDLYLGLDDILYRMDEDVPPAAPSNCAAHYITPDKSYCTWIDNSDDETGFRIEYQLDKYDWSFPPSKEIGAVLSLTIIPTVPQWDYCGFVFIVPFNSEPLPGDLVPAGAVFIPNTGLVDPEPWEDETGIVGYFLTDEFNYSTWEAVQEMKDAYDALKAQTDKPIGSIFYMPPNESWREKLVDLCNYLDFVLVDQYPYREGNSEEVIDALIQDVIDLAGDITSPLIVIPQGCNFVTGDCIDPGEAGVRHQFERYKAAGLPCCWYAWYSSAYPTDIRQTYQALMNEFYHGWTFFENKGVNATQSSQKQFSIGDKVKWRVRAYSGVGASAWAVSDSVYIGSQGSLKVWTSQADFESGTLSSALVPESLNRLELERLALTGTGTWIFDGGAGRKFGWLSFEHTNPNQNIYYRDDFRDNSLEAWVNIGGTWTAAPGYIRGTGLISWETNRMRVGSVNWQGQDILLKFYSVHADDVPNFFLRADAGAGNVNAYGFQLEPDQSNRFRVVNGSPADVVNMGTPYLPIGAWYWLRFQIYTTGGDVVTRVKWWLAGNEEPGWLHSHTYTGTWRSSGCFSIGRHSVGQETRYDNFLISRYEGIPSPPNCSVSFKFYPSNNGSSWGSEQTDITKAPNSRFIKIQATLSRTSLLSAMPTLEDMTLRYRLSAQPIFI